MSSCDPSRDRTAAAHGDRSTANAPAQSVGVPRGGPHGARCSPDGCEYRPPGPYRVWIVPRACSSTRSACCDGPGSRTSFRSERPEAQRRGRARAVRRRSALQPTRRRARAGDLRLRGRLARTWRCPSEVDLAGRTAPSSSRDRSTAAGTTRLRGRAADRAFAREGRHVACPANDSGALGGTAAAPARHRSQPAVRDSARYCLRCRNARRSTRSSCEVRPSCSSWRARL